MDNVPFIYLGFLPVWLVATLLWAWNNVRHGRHVRELHRRLSLLTLRYPTLAYPSLPYPTLGLLLHRCGVAAGHAPLLSRGG